MKNINLSSSVINEVFYVYEHIRLDTGAIFYVGKGKGARAYAKARKNAYWTRVVNKCGYKVNFVVKNIAEEFSFLVEKEKISQLKSTGVPLANATDGGEGMSGLRHSEESKEKIRVKATGRVGPMLGKTHSDETKEKIRVKAVGRINPMLGKTHSLSTRLKQSIAKIGKKCRKRTEAEKKRLIAIHLGSKRSKQTCKNISNALKGSKQKYMWITTGLHNLKILKTESIPTGWKIGRFAPQLNKGGQWKITQASP
jgi:hypothetical protein